MWANIHYLDSLRSPEGKNRSCFRGTAFEILTDLKQWVHHNSSSSFPSHVIAVLNRTEEFLTRNRELLHEALPSTPLSRKRVKVMDTQSSVGPKTDAETVLPQLEETTVTPARHLLPYEKVFLKAMLSESDADSMKRRCDTARAALVAIGVPDETCQAIHDGTSLLLSYLCQMVSAFDGTTNVPPLQIRQRLFRRDGDRWMLNDDGRYLLDLLGATYVGDQLVINSRKSALVCHCVETTLYRSLVHLKHYTQHKPIEVPQECVPIIERLVEAAQTGEPVPMALMTSLAKKLSTHALSIVFPNGAKDLPVKIPFDRLLYSRKIVPSMNEAVTALLIRYYEQLAAPEDGSESVRQKRQVLSVENVCGDLISTYANDLISLFGKYCMEVFPIPGFPDMLRHATTSSPPTQRSLPHLIGEIVQEVVGNQFCPQDFQNDIALARSSLVAMGFGDDILAPLSTVATCLPPFVLDLINLYQTHPTLEPPRHLKAFFSCRTEEGRRAWAMTDMGYCFCLALQGNTSGIGACLEANLLKIVVGICHRLTDPAFSLPSELLRGTDARQRVHVMTSFLLETIDLNTLALPRALRPLQPLMADVIRPVIESAIRSSLIPSLDALPESVCQSLSAPSREPQHEIAVPQMPRELYQRYKNLADALGPNLLKHVPEFSVLYEARQRDPSPPMARSVLFLAAECVRLVGEKLVREEDFAIARSNARDHFVQLGFPRAALDALGSAVGSFPDYVRTVVQAYHGKSVRPPGHFATLFHKANSDHVYLLNETGQLLLTLLQRNPFVKGVVALWETNVLTIVSNVLDQIQSGSVLLPPSLFDTTIELSVRTKELTQFVISICSRTEGYPLLLPSVLVPVEPLVHTVIESIMTAIIGEALFGLDTSLLKLNNFANGADCTTSWSPPEEVHAVAELPEAVKACSQFHELQRVLGPLIMDIPEFAPLKGSREQLSHHDGEVGLLAQCAGQTVQLLLRGLLTNKTDIACCGLKKQLKDFGLNERAISYPGQFVRSVIHHYVEILRKRGQYHPHFLDALFLPGSSSELSALGRFFDTMLDESNTEALADFIERNLLNMLLNMTKRVSDAQVTNPDYVFDQINHGLEAITEALDHWTRRESDPKAAADNAIDILNRLLGFVLPHKPSFLVPQVLAGVEPHIAQILRSLMMSGTRSGMSYLQDNFDSITTELMYSILFEDSLLKKFICSFPCVLREHAELIAATDVAKKTKIVNNLKKLSQALFPGLRLFGELIGTQASPFIGYGQLPFASIVNAAFEAAPSSQELAEKMFRKPTCLVPESLPGKGRITTPADVVRSYVLGMKEEVRKALAHTDIRQHFFKALYLACQMVALSIAALLAPSISVMCGIGLGSRLKTHELARQLFWGILSGIGHPIHQPA
jgi:hypothetical protein